jgi:LDH2 family malate/lactate/ureidoglycolate dehydrogenase
MENGVLSMLRLDSKRLEPIFARHLALAGVERESADHVIASLLQTSLRGVDSHGIQLYPHYVRAARAGRVNGAPRFAIENTGASTAILDADHAFGHHAGAAATDLAVDLASSTGAGIVSVRNSTHFGAAAYFALRAAERGCIGFSFTNADALVKAFNGRRAIFGTNPICFTAPMANEEPLCLDMATSLVSWNKIRAKRTTGEQIPPDWAFDKEGEPTTDPMIAVSLNPAGSYKGFGLGMMVEILCGMLAGGPIATELLPMFSSPIEARRHISHFFMAIDIGRFVAVDAFRQRLQGLVDMMRASPAMGEPVMAPGDPEKRTFVERSAAGIPVTQMLFDSLLEVSEEFREAVRK